MKKAKIAIAFLLLASVFDAEAKQIQVKVLNFSFSPKNFTANIGDTIHFVWEAGFHTTTSTSVPSGAADWDQPSDGSNTSFLYPVKVAGNYSFQCSFHFLMGMVGSFTVPFQANIVATKTVSVKSCSNTNSIQYKCSQSKPSFKVQLFRYGVAFGTVRTVTNTSAFTYSNLAIGSYFAIAKGNGGKDKLAGKSGISILMPVPTGLHASNVTSSKATLNWTRYSCVRFYTVQFRKKGAGTWTKVKTSGNKGSINLSGLAAKTKYQFEVASVDTLHKITATSKFSAIDSFVTAATAVITSNENTTSEKALVGRVTPNENSVSVYPNPTSANFKILIKNTSFRFASLKTIDGKEVWRESNSELLAKGSELNVNVGNLPAGLYILELRDTNNNAVTKKVMIAK